MIYFILLLNELIDFLEFLWILSFFTVWVFSLKFWKMNAMLRILDIFL